MVAILKVMQAQGKIRPPLQLARGLAGILGAQVIAFVAFLAGLAATTLVMTQWNSDAVYVICFGLAFLAGLFVTYRVSLSLACDEAGVSESLVIKALLCYAVSALVLSFVLVNIITELRSTP